MIRAQSSICTQLFPTHVNHFGREKAVVNGLESFIVLKIEYHILFVNELGFL